MSITFISDIQPFRYHRRIKICVSRIWRPKKFSSEAYDGLHYVLIDEKGDSIHAIIEENDYNHTHKMQEGCVYDIYKFRAINHLNGYKIMDRNVELRFNESTNFQKINETPCLIPRYAFQFLQFNELEAQMAKQTEMLKKNEHIVLRDMYGCIKDVKSEHKYVQSRNQWEDICVIVLENLRRESVNITLWGELARSVDQKNIDNLPPPVFAVFTSLRMTLYQGNITPTGTTHTCIILNPEIQETAEYQAEFSKPGDKPNIKSEKSREWKTISDLNMLDPDSYKNDTVICHASILRFPTHEGWWYQKCSNSRCFRELKESDDRNVFICAQHGVQTPVPWYRVYITIKDSEDVTTLKLTGKLADTFFGSTCETLLNKRQYKDKEDLPEEITNKINESHLFEIRIQPDQKIVKNIIPAPQSAESEKEQDRTSDIDPEPILDTPVKTTVKKRGANTIGKPLFISEQEKKLKRQNKGTTSSSARKDHDDQKEKID